MCAAMQFSRGLLAHRWSARAPAAAAPDAIRSAARQQRRQARQPRRHGRQRNAVHGRQRPDADADGSVDAARVRRRGLRRFAERALRAADKVPANVGAQLAKCSDGTSYCVPDAFIKSGGAAPPTCKSLNGADGVCLSVCVPQVEQYESLLPQDTCAADERCAPCINPLNNMPSGACDIGKPDRLRHRRRRLRPAAAARSQHAADVPVHRPAARRRLDADRVRRRRALRADRARARGDGVAARRLPSPAGTLCAPDVFIAVGRQLHPEDVRVARRRRGALPQRRHPAGQGAAGAADAGHLRSLREVRAVLLAARRQGRPARASCRAIRARRSRRSCSRTAAR